MDPRESLCTYDSRNPYGYISYGTVDDDEVVPAPRQQGCGCDNCFYGRDRLAMEIIRLRSAISEHAEVVRDTLHAGTDIDRHLWSVLETR